ncbi:helix-turn-helix domain-containing protein [Aneurinibacillus terranovensis]|uniref:helix-turn-helix domain-containing protein n=1 Tax=Aneurinibacillus terranovensis TaxID=278991 RepID=UPI000686EF58|nr:helix-turn-helix transcriptional regulator [Aneurinibacillus terranovensis]
MLGNRLSNLRKRLSLTQDQVSKHLGISRSAYANYESNNREPDNNTLEKFADFYGVTVDYLLGRDNTIHDINFTDLGTFSSRLKQGLTKKNITVEQVAEECHVKPSYIEELITDPKKLPGVGTLYKLAELIDVTPDYLAGFTDDPKGFDPRTPRPKEMEEFLDQEEVMFQGIPLSEEDKEKVKNVLAAVFMDAKKRNKRK